MVNTIDGTLTIELLEAALRGARAELVESRFEEYLRHARAQIAYDRHVRAWSLFAVQLIARRCLHDRTNAGGDHATLLREAEVLLGGVMTDRVDPELFHASGLLSYIKLLRSSPGEEKMIHALRARALFDAALAASHEPSPELLLDYATLELDDESGGDSAKALTLAERASRSPSHIFEAERLRRRIFAEEERFLADDPALGYIV